MEYMIRLRRGSLHTAPRRSQRGLSQYSDGLLAAGAIGGLLSCMFSAAMTFAAADSDAQPLAGPLSDFWPRVVSGWSRRLPGLNHGEGQTFMWVAMVWEGPDEAAIDDLADALQDRESLRWVRSQITKHRWSKISRRDLHKMQAMRQHLILIGTPEDNELVERALEATPLRVGRGAVAIGPDRIEGDDLLVVALSVNPLSPDHYALVFTGSSSAAVAAAAEISYGESDYVVLRGKKVLARGFFQWSGGKPTQKRPSRAERFNEHFNWRTVATRRYRLHHDPAATPAAEVARLGERMDAQVEAAARFLGMAPEAVAPIECFLYPSIEEKLRQTADSRIAHVESASLTLHAVYGGGVTSIEPALSAGILLGRKPPGWISPGGSAPRGLVFALSLACAEEFEGIPLPAWAARSSRDRGYLPMEDLLTRSPRPPGPDDLSLLEAASFVRDLVLNDGIEPMNRLYVTADRASLKERFREIFGRSMRDAEAAWLATLPSRAGMVTAASTPAAALGDVSSASDLAPALEAFRGRDDSRAEAILAALPATADTLTLLARINFRRGSFHRAAELAESALAAEGGVEQRAWARVTLGRAQAMLGRQLAAATELRGREIQKGPENVRILADYWLETMGQPLNQRAAGRQMLAQAETDLMNFRWEDAEKRLNILLAADPRNKEAHAALGKVYLSRYTYWHDFALLDNELFPGSTVDPDMYLYLAQKGQRELVMAAELPVAEDEHWLSEGAAPGESGTGQSLSHFLLGKAHFLQGRWEPARREFETALALQPRQEALVAYCHLYLARTSLALGDTAAAREHFKQAIKAGAGGHVEAMAKEELRKVGGASGP